MNSYRFDLTSVGGPSEIVRAPDLDAAAFKLWRGFTDAERAKVGDVDRLVALAVAIPPPAPDSLRDDFAGRALQGLCANPGGPFQANAGRGWGIVNCTDADIAAWAYVLADAMLKARGGQR